MSQKTITVTESALIKRIQRKLAHEGETLRKTRGERWRGELGDYYTVSDANCLVSTHVDLASYGRELGALRAGEAVG